MKKNLLSAAVAAGVALSSNAFSAQIEEVVVTAQKRAQSAQDIGITMTAMGSEDLKNLGVLEASQITEFVPNMELQDTGDSGIPIFVIRGVGLGDFNVNNTPTTAVVVDDVYQPYGVYTAFSLFDTERAEVLKGPQGGLYGRNSTGGAINIVSKKPNFESIEGDIEADLGKYGEQNVRAGISVPLTDKLAVRLAGTAESSDGYFYNSYLNQDAGGKDKQQARLTLSFQPSDALSMDLRHTYGSDESEVPFPETMGWLNANNSFATTTTNGGVDGQFLADAINALSGLTAQFPVLSGPVVGGTNSFPDDQRRLMCDAILQTGVPSGPDCVNAQGQLPDGRYIGQDTVNRHNNDEFNSTSLNLKWDAGLVTLDSISNFTKLSFLHTGSAGTVGMGVDEPVRADLEAVAAETGRDINFDTMYITDYGSEMESWSQELRLSSNDTEGYSWMAGLTYAEDTFDEHRTCDFGAYAQVDWTTFPGCATMEYTQETKATSVYGQLAMDLTDTLTLTVDGRITKEEKDYIGSTLVNDGVWTYFISGVFGVYGDPALDFQTFDFYLQNFAGGDINAPFVLGLNTVSTYDETEPSWKVNMDWKPNDDVLVYASVGRSFKSGGFFGGFFTGDAAVAPYKPETNTAYEVGFKSTLADGSVQLNGATFFYDYKDRQSNLSLFDEATGASFNGLNTMGDVEVYGAELDLRWLPIEGLDLRAALGYMETEITKGPDPSKGTINNVFAEPIDVTGNELNNAPKLSANLLARYDFSVTNELGMAVQVGVNWQDDYFHTLSNEPIYTEKGRALTNARLELYQDADTGWKVALWGKNLTDEQYRTTALEDGIQNGYSYWSAPRTYGATASYDF